MAKGVVMEISRRQFNKLAMTSCAFAAAGASAIRPVFADSPLTAQQIVDKISVAMGPAWSSASYRDTFKMGDPNTPVNAVASCFMATFDVIKRAHEKGLNFVITHEPTMWTDQDFLPPVQNDPLFKLKLEYVNDNKMIVWRTHDSLHKMRPEPMITAENKKLGWNKYTLADDAKTYQFPPATVRDFVEEYVEKAPTRSVRVVGDPNRTIKSATQCGHGFGQNVEGLEKYDATISIEVREWETAEYGRDLIASGGKGTMIITAHESGEENMMQAFPAWFQQLFPTIHIEFVPTTDRLWTL
jgi:putative NIF3 family GTP cyclohydrolase 1 type 2